MKRFIASLIASAAFLAFATPSYAQMAAPTKAPKMMKSSMKSGSMSSMKGMKGSSMSSSMAMKCSPGTKMVKGYTKKDGTMVKSYCRKG